MEEVLKSMENVFWKCLGTLANSQSCGFSFFCHGIQTFVCFLDKSNIWASPEGTSWQLQALVQLLTTSTKTS